MEIGDIITYSEDMLYRNSKGESKVIKKGHKFIVKIVLDYTVVAERYGKPFLLYKDKIVNLK